MSGNILDTIMAEKRREIVADAAAVPLSALQAEAGRAAPCLGFAARLRNAKSPAIIAEIKRASPSKGAIRPDLDPVQTAKEFVAGGAACLSILTDKKFFQGDLEFLKAVRAAVPETPLLRKDFVCHPYQVWQSRAARADAILLIVAALEDGDLALLAKEARTAGLDVLVEVHTAEELERALKLPVDDGFILGINNRDLKTFNVDLGVTKRLMEALSPDSTPFVVSESGIFTPADIALLTGYGARAFLVGEALVATGNPGENLRRLLER